MRWLLDEMLPAATAAHLSERGHDAISVHKANLAGCDDGQVFAYAVNERRILVTENFGDYAKLIDQCLSRDEPCVPVVFVRKADFPRGGGLLARLAAHLDKWAANHPEPYLGPHWP